MSDKVAGKRADVVGNNGDKFKNTGTYEEARIDEIVKSHQHVGDPGGPKKPIKKKRSKKQKKTKVNSLT